MNKQQLANKIWASANKMRSKIEANEYKDYILGLIFYKFLSDTEVKWLVKKGWETDEFADLRDDSDNQDDQNTIEECKNTIGYFIEYKYLFNTWIDGGAFDVSVLSEALSSFDRLMNPDFRSVYDGIFKTLRGGLSKLGENPASQTKALKGLIKLIKDIPTDGSQNYDVLGYVYEFLISNFAASAGKKAGEFYTPHEVAMVMSEIVAEHHKSKTSLEIYDPTSGSGSLLITIGKAVGKHIKGKNSVKYYAQELKENTYNLTRMNLVMRGIIPANIVTRCADTLEEDWPVHEEGVDIARPLAVDAVVSNPPYSQHWDVKNKELDPRFVNYGVAPKTKADYAFLLHELHHLKPDGILTIVMPHGVLFRGGSEGQIRSNLIEKNNIDAIIGLPANIFFGTGIPTLIMVLRKNRSNEGVLIIDASKGFVKDGKQNKLRACDVKKIADTYRERTSIPGYSREVSRDEIRSNDYNLNIPRYVDSSEPTVHYDIYATMFGGIPNSEIAGLQTYWNAFPSLRQQLFAAAADKPYSTVNPSSLTDAINANDDVKAFRRSFADAFGTFRQLLHQRLIDHVETVRDVEENDIIADNIFRRIHDLPLIDGYAAYQILADHWQDIMGDIEIIQKEGMRACNVVEEKFKIVTKDGVEEEKADGQKGRILPFDLIQRTLLAEEFRALATLKDEKEQEESNLQSIMDGLDEEAQASLLNEDNTKWDYASLFNDACEECGFKGTKAKKEAQFLQYGFEDDSAESILQQVIPLQAKIKQLNSDLKNAEAALEDHTVAAIKSLDMKQINSLLELKWIAPITDAIEALPDKVVSSLADAVNTLAQKYETTYSDIEHELDSSKQTLAELVSQLSGDEFAIEGLSALIKD